jgi:agmatinase
LFLNFSIFQLNDVTFVSEIINFLNNGQNKHFFMNSINRNLDFDPNGVGLKNGNFIGLPFTENTANVILIPVPWDVTVSYREGTAYAPQAILDASAQLDLFDADVENAWRLGIYMQPVDEKLLARRVEMRPKATKCIDFIESGGTILLDNGMKALQNEVNYNSQIVNDLVYANTKLQLENDKLVGIIGGDHSVPLGCLKALSEKYPDFGILQIDAHLDLRNSYEGFTYSHASIFHNALKINEISKLVQVGIRDYCEEEVGKIRMEGDRVKVFYDRDLKEGRFAGENWCSQCDAIVAALPDHVYISFDIDGLDPTLCPKTGTPVPGGLDFSEAVFLLKKVVESGRKIIGFDLCEVGNNEWDANVGARLIYKMSNLMGRSLNRI